MPSSNSSVATSRAQRVGFGIAGVVILIVIWEAASRLGILPSDVAPSASRTGQELLTLLHTGAFWTAVGHTLAAWAIGSAIIVFIAVPAGLILGASPRIGAWLRSTIEALRPVPPIVVLPLAVLLLGATLQFNTAMIAQGIFWLLLIQVSYASRTVPSIAIDTAQAFRIGRLRRYLFVRLPAAVPVAATAIRLGVAIALAVEIMSEMIGGAPGLGQMLVIANQGNDVQSVYAITVFIGILGLAVASGLRAVERMALRPFGPED